MLAFKTKDSVNPIGTTIKALNNEYGSNSETITVSTDQGFGLNSDGIYVLTTKDSNERSSYTYNSNITRDSVSINSICKPDGSTDYTNFDTNKDLFYYDEENNKSDVFRLDDSSDLVDLIPNIAGSGKTISKYEEETSDATLMVTENTGSYVKNNTKYYAYRAIGKLTNVTEDEILDSNIVAQVTARNSLNQEFVKNYNVNNVYRTLKSNGNVLEGCEEAKNTWYFYFVISGITDSYNGYSFNITFNVTINNINLSKSLNEYNISIEKEKLLIKFDDINSNITSTYNSDNFNIYVQSTKTINVNNCNVTIGSITFTKSISMSGSAKDIYSNTIEVFIESPTTVKIYCNLKEAGRGIAIYDDTFTKVTGCEYTETEQQDRCITFTVSNSGTYYIGSTNSGITIYGIEIIY